MKEELFHIDIETRGSYKDYDSFKENDEYGALLFKDKYERTEWKNKYESVEDAYLNQSPLLSTYGEICCISFGFLVDKRENRISSFYGSDEKEIVTKFNELLKRVQLKNFRITGFRILYFDIPWILHKLHKYDIEPADIIKIYGVKPWETRLGDMSDDWRYKGSFNSSFEEICYELGISNPKKELRAENVHTSYWGGDIENIKAYCERDIEASIELSKYMYLYNF